MSQSEQENSEWAQENVGGRIVRLPLLSSALQMVSSVYTDLKDRYALLGLLGDVAEVSVRSVSQAAAEQATPLIQRLEPQIRVANSYAGVGLDQLEKRVPILHQSVEEVMGHLKDALFLTLDDLQLRVTEELDRIGDRAERVMHGVENTLGFSLKTALSVGIDNLLTYSEETADYFLHLPPELQRELESRIQEYEDDNDEEEPGLWARVRSLLLWLSLYLYHRARQLKASLQNVQHTLGSLYNTVGLAQLVEAVSQLSQRLMAFSIARGHQLVALKDAVINQLAEVTRIAVGLPPMFMGVFLSSRARENLAVFLGDLQELSKILLQLLINTTPLYNMLERPSEQQLEDDLIQEYMSERGSSRRASANSLLHRTPDGRPRRRRSLYARFRRGSSGAGAANDGSQGSQTSPSPEIDATAVPSTGAVRRRSSAAEALLAPIKQLVSQSQRALEYLTPTPHQEDTGTSVEEDSQP